MAVRRSRWRPVPGLAGVATLTFGVASLGASGTGPQPPPQPPPIFRSGVSAVRVDVSVSDSSGRPFEHLEQADFELEEDGVPQQIDSVQFLRLDGQPPPDSDESLPIRSREHGEAEAARDDVRVFAVFLDDYHVDRSPAVNIPLRRALVGFVDELGPTDLVAVMEPLTAIADLRFTRSRPALEATMRAFEGRLGQIFPIKGPAEEAQLTQRDVWRIRAQVTLSSLQALASYLGGLREGRKSILFVSQGPPAGPMSDLRTDVDAIVEAANRGNVTISVLDPRGMQGPFGGSDVMHRLAQETGGRAIVSTNNLSGGLARVIEDASAYYLIGYIPAREYADGRFHRIAVRVKRRGARVTARRGYWAPSAAEMTAAAVRAPAAASGLVEALSTLSQSTTGRSADVWVGFSPGEGARTRLSVAWETVPGAGGSPPAAERLDIEPLAPGGQTPLAGVESIAQGEEATLDLVPAPATLRFTLIDKDGGTLDRWTEPAVIPALNDDDLWLATPRLLRAQSVFEFRALQANQRPTPVASRRFSTSDRVLVDIECHADGGAAAAVTAQILNRQSQTLLTLEVPTPVAGRTRLEIPVRSLAPSDYVLRVRASTGNRQVEQLVAFRVAS
jgi:VWFA-related protein